MRDIFSQTEEPADHRRAVADREFDENERKHLRERIESCRLAVLHENARNGLIPLLLACFALAALLSNFGDNEQVFRWLAGMLALLCLRFALIWRYPGNSNSGFNWIRSQVTVLFGLGVAFGGLPFLISGLSTPVALAYVNLWLAGLAFSITLSQGIVVSAAIAFAVPTMGPIMGIYLFSGDATLILVGIANALLFSYLYLTVRRTRRTFLDEVTHRVKYEMLAKRIEHERNRSETLVQSLSAEVERRKEAEVRLRKARDTAETISNQDHLTGLANRRVFDTVMSREWYRGMRNRHSLAMIICDIDFFKAYNDIYGMHAGDQCLVRIATVVNDHIRRAGDLASRYGGEEFAVLLPDTTEVSAVEMAESMRAGIFEQTILHAGSDIERVITASFGVATLVPNEDSRPNELVQVADHALSRAKRGGGNCVFTVSRGIQENDDSLHEE